MHKRKDGYWEDTFVIDGKHKSVYGKSKNEVYKKIKDIQEQSIENNHSFKKIAEAYLNYIEPSMEETEFASKKYRIEYFYPSIGKKDIQSITVNELQNEIEKLYVFNPTTGKKTSFRTIGKYIHACSNVFEFTEMLNISTYNPAKYLLIPKGAAKGNRDETAKDDVEIIINSTDIRFLPIKIMLYTGLRKGEIGALQFKDIDFQNKYIRINKSLNYKTNSIKPPKTQAGNRLIPIPEVLMSELEAFRKNYVPIAKYNSDGTAVMHNTVIKPRTATPNDYLITGISCGRMTNNSWEKLLQGLKKDYDISLTYHMLRHSYSSMLYTAGVDPLTMQALLGHSNAKITLDIYTHLSKEKKLISIDKLNEYLMLSVEQ